VQVLTLWALENPSPSYRQGMHELLAPLVYVLETEKWVADEEERGESQRGLRNGGSAAAAAAGGGGGDGDGGSDSGGGGDETILRQQLDGAYTEHDAYALFCRLMVVMADFYAGVEEHRLLSQHIVCQIYDPLLKHSDPALFNHLTQLEITPQLFALPWVRLGFGREFEL
jgi:TBC1 domain family protein 5